LLGASRRRQHHFELHLLASQGLQHAGNPGPVLGADPVHLEAVGHGQRDLVAGIGHLGREWPDPGVELLLGHVLREFFDAGQPQIGSSRSAFGQGGEGGMNGEVAVRRKTGLWTAVRHPVGIVVPNASYPHAGFYPLAPDPNLPLREQIWTCAIFLQ
jgi:hypothetical protein